MIFEGRIRFFYLTRIQVNYIDFYLQKNIYIFIRSDPDSVFLKNTESDSSHLHPELQPSLEKSIICYLLLSLCSPARRGQYFVTVGV